MAFLAFFFLAFLAFFSALGAALGLFGVAVADIEVVFGRENVNKQLRIKAPKQLPAVFTAPV